MILNRPIIAITGSKGKTTTKEMVFSVLKQRWDVFASIKNGNDPWFTSQYRTQIKESHQAVVLEYGMTQAGDIKKSCQLIQPSISVITNVGRAHIENFDDHLYGIAAAKSEIVQGMDKQGILLLNADDHNSSLINTSGFQGEIITIGINNPADYHAYDIYHSWNGIRFCTQLDNIKYEFHLPILGRHNVYNTLFCIAISHRLGLTADEIKAGFSSYQHPPLRLQLHCIDEIKIIDDSYNTSPEAHCAAVDVISELGEGTNVLILGHTLACDNEGHQEIGKYIAKQNIHYLFTLGDSAKSIGEGAVLAGFTAKNVHHCSTQEILYKQLFQIKERKITVLIKGAGILKMYTIIKFIKTFFVILRKKYVINN